MNQSSDEKTTTNPDSYVEASFFCLGREKSKACELSQSHKLFYMEVDMLVCSRSWTPCSQVHPPKAWASHCL